MQIPKQHFDDIRIYDSLDLVKYADLVVDELENRQIARDRYKKAYNKKMKKLKGAES